MQTDLCRDRSIVVVVAVVLVVVMPKRGEV